MTFVDTGRVRFRDLLVGFFPAVLTSAVRGGPVVQWWVSSSDMSRRLAGQGPLRFGPGPHSAATVVRVDPGRTFQTILGLGSSLEHSTCYNIARLPKERQAKVMENLVDAESGIGTYLMARLDARSPPSAGRRVLCERARTYQVLCEYHIYMVWFIGIRWIVERNHERSPGTTTQP